MPLSHCSPCSGSMIESPHFTSLHVVRHAESGLLLLLAPRSHCSLSVSITPLPHTSSERQLSEQPSPACVLPASQTSPASASTIRLPHVSSDRQSPEQPSALSLLPSSQTSFVSLT